MVPPHANNLAYYTPKTTQSLRSKSHSNVVKLAKHSDFFDLSYERSGKKLKQRNITLLMLHTGSLNFVETACTLWYYGWSGFQVEGTK